MAKGQLRPTKEKRKPKAEKNKPAKGGVAPAAGGAGQEGLSREVCRGAVGPAMVCHRCGPCGPA
jgi:hypothetical protein